MIATEVVSTVRALCSKKAARALGKIWHWMTMIHNATMVWHGIWFMLSFGKPKRARKPKPNLLEHLTKPTLVYHGIWFMLSFDRPKRARKPKPNLLEHLTRPSLWSLTKPKRERNPDAQVYPIFLYRGLGQDYAVKSDKHEKSHNLPKLKLLKLRSWPRLDCELLAELYKTGKLFSKIHNLRWSPRGQDD